MWKRAEVTEGQRFRVVLCQGPTGKRTFALQPMDDARPPVDAVFTTEEVPNELLLRRDFEGIAKAVRLTNGKRFSTDAHGIWLTQEEMAALSAGIDHSRVPWVNGMPANFSPR
jgi:hypothetical protein